MELAPNFNGHVRRQDKTAYLQAVCGPQMKFHINGRKTTPSTDCLIFELTSASARQLLDVLRTPGPGRTFAMTAVAAAIAARASVFAVDAIRIERPMAKFARHV